MSAVNVFVNSRRACLLTDTSLYDAKGTIIGFDLKAFAVESWTGVITGRGNTWGIVAVHGLAECFASFDEFVARSAPEIERAHRAALAAGELVGQTFVEVHVIGWSEHRDRPEHYIFISPGPLDSDRPNYIWDAREEEEGWFLQEHFYAHDLWVLHRQGAEPVEDFTLETFDPIRHGIPLMEMQRQRTVDPAMGLPAGTHVIGGDLWLTIVDRDGARQDVIREWGDVAGEPICPAPFDEASLPQIPPSGLPASWTFARFDAAFRGGAIDPETHELDRARLAVIEAATPAGSGLSRQQRRAAKAQARKGGLARV